MNKKGTTADETKTIILLVVFVSIALIIISAIFYFSLFGLGAGVPRLTTSPATCSITYVNYSIPGKCIYSVTASSGSPGLGYSVYDNITGKIGSYIAGENTYAVNVTLPKGLVMFTCNTTGANSSTGGYYYTAGGGFSLTLPCG